jgi:hypothetical protein
VFTGADSGQNLEANLAVLHRAGEGETVDISRRIYRGLPPSGGQGNQATLGSAHALPTAKLASSSCQANPRCCNGGLGQSAISSSSEHFASLGAAVSFWGRLKCRQVPAGFEHPRSDVHTGRCCGNDAGGACHATMSPPQLPVMAADLQEEGVGERG